MSPFRATSGGSETFGSVAVDVKTIEWSS